MTSTTAAIICSLVGGGLEIAGVLTVVQGIREDRKQAREMLEPDPVRARREPPRSPRTSAMQLRRGHTGGLGSATLRSIAARQYESEAAIVNALGRLTDQVNDVARQLDAELREEMAASDSELRKKVRYLLDESAGGRKVGVVLISAGIAFAMAGAVLGAVS